MHPYILEMLAKENRRRIDEEVKRIHLLKMSRHGSPGVGRFLFVKLGEGFIHIGLWMKHRYEPACPEGRYKM